MSYCKMLKQRFGSVAFLVLNLATLITFALNTTAFLRSTETLQHPFTGRVQPHVSKSTRTLCLFENKGNDCDESGLKIAIVGGGPSGLLLSHRLFQDRMGSNANHKITLFDGRSDPRTNELEERAYPLGIGIRGRSAIRSVDENLWKKVKSRGYESERFNLHIGLPGSRNKGLVIPLRKEPTTVEEKSLTEPSLLIYQSELCRTLLEELEERPYGDKDDLKLYFDSKVLSCDFDAMTIDVSSAGNSTNTFGPFDLIVGCDGVNSCVRTSIDQTFAEFSTTRSRLPGVIKVVRLNHSVGETAADGTEPYDPSAVSLLIPSGALSSQPARMEAAASYFQAEKVAKAAVARSLSTCENVRMLRQSWKPSDKRFRCGRRTAWETLPINSWRRTWLPTRSIR